jgi:FKBP-type peptidyl-prolyl cis-trans isomerase SlyD
MTELKVADDLVVSLDYTARLTDGKVIATTATEEKEAVEFLQGRGQIFPPVEQALYGMAVGDDKEVVVTPDEGYGERHPEAVQLVPHERFPPDMTPQLGMRLNVEDSSGQPFEAYVTSIRPDGVLLDFNHPLAGQTLHFEVKVSALRPATEEELAHGYPHSGETD